MTVAKRRVARPVEPFELTADEKQVLERWSRGRTVSQALARRARIVLGCAAGRTCTEVASEQKTSIQTVSKWRQRFVDHRLDGMADTPHPNVHRKLADERVEELVRATLQELPKGATHWSTRKLAKRVGVSQSSVSRVWRAFHLKPHRRRTFTLNPPDHAVVLCLDEKSQIQALERRQPVLPLIFGHPERVTATYNRHGTTNLFAALDVASGKVIGECYPLKRAAEFRRFLSVIDKQVPSELAVHVVVDNSSIHASPPIRRWLQRHPRFHMHFTPTYSSWLNLVERWFAKLTEEALRRGSHLSTRELREAIEDYIEATNDEPRPFVWTKSADEILASVARFCAHTLADANS